MFFLKGKRNEGEEKSIIHDEKVSLSETTQKKNREKKSWRVGEKKLSEKIKKNKKAKSSEK